ncbi:MAG: hypothetical protein IAE85_00285 [Anaerolinea sp.]|nr:hypothetical protein [Anaerolinea sp.]
MQRRHLHRLFSLLLAAILLASSVLGAAAQSPQPPIDQSGLADQHILSRPGQATEATKSPGSPDIALGQAGTMFRHVQTYGETATPYLADGQHLNGPNSLVVDGNNSLYVVEELGNRLLKYNSSGANTLTLGQAGQPWHHDRFLSIPRGAAVDGAGNIWVTIDQAIKVFDAAGNLILTFPDAEPWNSGSDNSHFNQPRGIAFDATGRLFVADRYNHRVQVYLVNGGVLTHQATIGVTGQPGSDNAHFNGPAEIALDPSGRLYVADVENFRVQRCAFTTGWTCSPFHGTGVAGGGAGQLNWAFGLGIDSTGNRITIADSANGRVKQCNNSGACSVLITGLRWPADVAEDSAGRIYVSDYYDSTVRRYNSSGALLSVFAGVSGTPYVTDGQHLNRPWGLGVTPDGSIYVTEHSGYRLVKLDSNGVMQWTVGQAGVPGNDNAHFGGFGGGPAGVAVGPDASVLVADSANHRVQVFNAQGGYVATLGSEGTGNYQFSWPTGVAVDRLGHIYVADCGNHRVQIYNSSRIYLATIGATGNPGGSNGQFRCPHGLAVDGQDNLYVADIDNARVQVFDSQRNYVRTVGVTGQPGDDFSRLSGPAFVAVDGQRRLYVADTWNARVQVFDPTGAYLTTIGGDWGERTGQLRDPGGIAVDGRGNVYIADNQNHRVQKYAPGLPGWMQVNVNGFGERDNWGVWSLGVFGDRLYASAANRTSGAEVYRLAPNGTWDRVATGGFGDPSNVGIDRLIEFNGHLFASTWVEDGSGAQIWRSPSGAAGTWSQVAQGGLGSTNNAEFMALAVFNDHLYAGTWVGDTGVHGAEIWRSATGDNGSWTRVASNGFDNDPHNGAIISMKSFGGALYAATMNWANGGEVWRTSNGVQWTQVNFNGFGNGANTHVSSLEVFDGRLYAGTRHSFGGGEIWRTANGTSWESVMLGGFGTPDNRQIATLIHFRGELLAVAGNFVTGPEVWQSGSGEIGSWQKVVDGGFGAGYTALTAWDNHAAVYRGSLYIGTYTFGNSGGKLWKYLHNRIYLPKLDVE